MEQHPHEPLARLSVALRSAGVRPDFPSPDRWELLLDPAVFRGWVEQRCAGHVGRVRIAGPLDRRLAVVERTDGRWVVADLSGQPHRSRAWPAWTREQLILEDPASWLSLAHLDERAVWRLSRPSALLAALYHPETFPLPRFPLGISTVARAARDTLLGTVALADMQLGLSLDGLVARIDGDRPDILGVSATFGQYDLLVELLESVYAQDDPPLVVAGGSLTLRVERVLLDRFPSLLVARAGGEATIGALLAHWHGDCGLDDVPGLGYAGAPRGGGLAVGRRRTAKPVTRDVTADVVPELDLLPATFDRHGVAQLETSRGCTSYCSFCPRDHKGSWVGAGTGRLPWLLGELSAVFERYPQVSRTLYLVDEEFLGRAPDATSRALELASLLHRAGFGWESSCRVDQVVDPDQSHGWHVERAEMWRALVARGLRRMLFGVESGVDSILDRFAKDTTGEQNLLAVRTLSALGVPTRFTYITFDPLMTLDELKATHAFQGRTDLLLAPQPDLSPAEVVRGVRDARFAAAAGTGQPFYQGISYLLVSMECLIGAAYTRRVQQAGLAGAVTPSMGRVEARYADWRIGVAASWAQRWVDRHFALDYTFKSLEKVLDGAPRRQVREARGVLKDASYTVLGDLITELDTRPLHRDPTAEAILDVRIWQRIENRLALLRGVLAAAVHDLLPVFGREHAALLVTEHRRWSAAGGWTLINAADACAS
ncbi:Fe-S oxidoreductase [Frankia casuarinae]|uniref:Radical SAM n=1 Tax=Frankia casuarinae (strain DSM 45818 / CECT 9043 / HFP020203 / CcI3) TaxID=106370 RepID=Q2JC13_FRACC|nr:Radical SAM [Frankia casuarinae]EYT91219.1 Fe-S oxidoreductase [Frankia casuarinae]